MRKKDEEELQDLRARETRRQEALEKGRQPGVRRGGRFRYSWEDLAQALGRTPRTVQRWARQGRFDPRDFASVVRLLRAQTGSRTA